MRNAKRTCNRAYPIQQSHVHTLWQWYVPVHDNAASILRASFFYKLLLLAARMQHAAETRSIQRAATYNPSWLRQKAVSSAANFSSQLNED